MVLMERWIAPSDRFAAMPSAPRAIWDAASSSASMVITTSPRHAPARAAVSCAPSAMSGPLFPGVRLNTVTSCPALTRLAAIAEPMRPSPMNPSFIQSSPMGRPSGTLRRGHELRTDGIKDRRVHDAFDLLPVRTSQRPARDTQRGLELIRAAAAPQRDADALVEHPTHRQLNHMPAEAALSELIELPHGLEILRKTRRLKFRIDVPQIVTLERGVGSHATAEQASTQGAITERHDAIGAGIGQDVRLNGALKEIVGRLNHVQGGHLAKAFHLRNREIAYADSADLSCLEKRTHRLGRFLDRYLGVGPVDLVNVDIIGP